MARFLEETPVWFARRKCADVSPRVFFPDNHDRRGIAEAKRICTSCPVSEQCLAYAIDHRILMDGTGIWGGVDPLGRRSLLRSQRRERDRQRGAA